VERFSALIGFILILAIAFALSRRWDVHAPASTPT
jgi:hypothetical protein